ncbi:hypothetical protein SGFS_090470 [Streptomyces graminofaciens]|uniref:Uncharacterized protein n=1 Tax=Streptomyces graminofaciens TaxID=68212 RepID=A0ABM7FN41_9ACTN|nr:hypothetical protein [Streptomyces graminofaciens]BBC37753.1 hypothetical protein SGFS_090470 [Streptomyces graminofaciens]
MIRRLLPTWARAVAGGRLEPLGWKAHGLRELDWRSWPARQTAAVEAFVCAWWADVVATPEPGRSVDEVFEACASILGTAAPLLERWPPGPVTDAHLVSCADGWIDDLLRDSLPFFHSDDELGLVVVPELQAWPARQAPARIEPHDYGLAVHAGLLGLPEGERGGRLH